MNRFIHKLNQVDAHHRVMISSVVAAVVALLTGGHFRLPVEVVLVWNAFCLSILALSWVRIATSSAFKSYRTAKLQDSGRTAIFLFVVAAACMSLFAVAYLIGSAKGLQRKGLTEHVLVAVLTVAGSWCLVHTLFTLRYAHIYYGDNPDDAVPGPAGGLDFPGEKRPDYLDFAYFSFVVGMTCQVSDVQISGRRLRRLALLHGLLAFAFNAVILALSINLVSGLFAG